MTKPKAPKDMTAREVLDHNMSRAEWSGKLAKKPIRHKKHSEWAKTNEENLRTLARARVRTQFRGEDDPYRCEGHAKMTGERCRKRALKGEKFCLQHANAYVRFRLKQRRLSEGRPAQHASVIARGNLRRMLRQNMIPRDLMLQPAFQAVMQYVVPKWFGKPETVLDKETTRQRVKVAALLGREMVLAWLTAVDTGDLRLWTQVVIKVRESGFLRG